ncbi:MAG: hypothetical protein M1826_001261 [Phylliscum demangeonii]|nr:MAG: hypothetical protein M1826_001261 [Phylliscum demangeonii]
MDEGMAPPSTSRPIQHKARDSVDLLKQSRRAASPSCLTTSTAAHMPSSTVAAAAAARALDVRAAADGSPAMMRTHGKTPVMMATPDARDPYPLIADLESTGWHQPSRANDTTHLDRYHDFSYCSRQNALLYQQPPSSRAFQLRTGGIQPDVAETRLIAPWTASEPDASQPLDEKDEKDERGGKGARRHRLGGWFGGSRKASASSDSDSGSSSSPATPPPAVLVHDLRVGRVEIEAAHDAVDAAAPAVVVTPIIPRPAPPPPAPPLPASTPALPFPPANTSTITSTTTSTITTDHAPRGLFRSRSRRDAGGRKLSKEAPLPKRANTTTAALRTREISSPVPVLIPAEAESWPSTAVARARRKPMLDVEIPSTRLERYSIMFEAVLRQHASTNAPPTVVSASASASTSTSTSTSPSLLLARRQMVQHVDRLHARSSSTTNGPATASASEAGCLPAHDAAPTPAAGRRGHQRSLTAGGAGAAPGRRLAEARPAMPGTAAGDAAPTLSEPILGSTAARRTATTTSPSSTRLQRSRTMTSTASSEPRPAPTLLRTSPIPAVCTASSSSAETRAQLARLPAIPPPLQPRSRSGPVLLFPPVSPRPAPATVDESRPLGPAGRARPLGLLRSLSGSKRSKAKGKSSARPAVDLLVARQISLSRSNSRRVHLGQRPTTTAMTVVVVDTTQPQLQPADALTSLPSPLSLPLPSASSASGSGSAAAVNPSPPPPYTPRLRPLLSHRRLAGGGGRSPAGPGLGYDGAAHVVVHPSANDPVVARAALARRNDGGGGSAAEDRYTVWADFAAWDATAAAAAAEAAESMRSEECKRGR